MIYRLIRYRKQSSSLRRLPAPTDLLVVAGGGGQSRRKFKD